MPKDAQILCRISKDLKTWLDEESARRGEAVAVVIREALREYRANKEKAAAETAPIGTDAPPKQPRP